MPVLSTEDQNLDLQIDHLTKDGYSKILTEKLTGRNNARPALDKVLKLLRPGDIGGLEAGSLGAIPQGFDQ